MFNDYKNTIDKLLLQLFRPTVTIKRTAVICLSHMHYLQVNVLVCAYVYTCMYVHMYICLKTCTQGYPLFIQYAAIQYACTVHTAAKVHSVRINTAHFILFLACIYCTLCVQSPIAHMYIHLVWAPVIFAVHRKCVETSDTVTHHNTSHFSDKCRT